MRRPNSPEDTPATVQQLAAAMTALGMYHGANTQEEHAAEAARLGGMDAYRVRMVNAWMGLSQTVVCDRPTATDLPPVTVRASG